jgi:uncharacterized membrane protein (DUF4010 family)
MDGSFAFAHELATPFKLLTGLAIGLLLGLQREKTPSAKAGLRTFGLVGLFGTIAALVADAVGNAWIVATGLALVGVMIVAAYHRSEEPEADSGTTTVIAVLLCYGLGVMVWHDRSQLAVSVAIVATMLLHFKTELHGLSARLSRQDVASILQFAVLTFIILPLFPDRGIGPYGVLNPHHIWLMVVVVSGVSLIGYLALRLIGTRQSLLLVGIFGGLVSSTATTLVYAREARSRAAMLPIGGAIIVISNLVVLVRLAVLGAVVAPGALSMLLPVIGTGLAVGVALLVREFRKGSAVPELRAPELSNPTSLRVAVGFGALYALVLFVSAWLSEQVGAGGLYALAVVSGFVDVDAITLSGLQLFNTGSIGAGVAVIAIGFAYLAAVAFKLALLGFLGGRAMLAQFGLLVTAPALGVAGGLLLFGAA